MINSIIKDCIILYSTQFLKWILPFCWWTTRVCLSALEGIWHIKLIRRGARIELWTLNVEPRKSASHVVSRSFYYLINYYKLLDARPCIPCSSALCSRFCRWIKRIIKIETALTQLVPPTRAWTVITVSLQSYKQLPDNSDFIFASSNSLLKLKSWDTAYAPNG